MQALAVRGQAARLRLGRGARAHRLALLRPGALEELVHQRYYLADLGVAEVAREEMRDIVHHALALRFPDRPGRRPHPTQHPPPPPPWAGGAPPRPPRAPPPPHRSPPGRAPPPGRPGKRSASAWWTMSRIS